MMFNLLLVLGVAFLSAALRSFQHPLLFRLGTLGIVVTSFLAGWLLGGHIWLGIAFAISWIFLPWLEILTRVRRLRLPIERTLTPRMPPSRHAFPGFEELTQEVESEGFEYLEDTGWDHEDSRQFYRVFHHPKKCIQASICLAEQNDLAFFYLSLTSRAKDGYIFITWNYPFSYGLKLLPKLKINRVGGPMSFADMLKAHDKFLHDANSSELLQQSPEQIMQAMQSDMRAQISHNLHLGLLKRDGECFIRYTIRGMFFLWFQFLRDLVRLS